MWEAFIGLFKQILFSIQGVVGDWGLAIIILTVIIRILITPLAAKQASSMARMQVAQPRLKAIQERYAGDPQRQAEELRAAYSELKFNPIGGCLPLLLQMPIFIALFNVTSSVPKDASFYNIIPQIASSPADMTAEYGLLGAIPHIAILVLFALLVFLPIAMNSSMAADQLRTSRVTGAAMSLMLMFFGWKWPSAVMLYYVISSAWGVVQQKLITKKIVEQAKAEAEEQPQLPQTVNVVRREKKARPHKKSK